MIATHALTPLAVRRPDIKPELSPALRAVPRARAEMDQAPSVGAPLGNRFQPTIVKAAPSSAEASVAAAERRARNPLATRDGDRAPSQRSPEPPGSGEQRFSSEQATPEGAVPPESMPLAPLESANEPLSVQGACACDKCETCAAKAVQMAPAGNGEPSVAGMNPATVLDRLGAGTPLPPRLAVHFGRLFGRDLLPVRVHPDSAVVASLGARALTVGAHVAFAPGEYRPEQGENDFLLAHELAHVVQQGGGTGVGVQGAGLGYGAYEAEADQAAATATRGGVVHRLTPVRNSRVQGNIFGDAWDAVGDAAEWTYDNTAGRAIDWVKDKFWAVVRRIAPGVEKYLRNPGLIWDEIVGGVKGFFRDLLDGVLGPFAKGGALAGVGDVLGDMASKVGSIVSALVAGDCKPLFAALGPIIARFKSFASPVIDAAEKVFSAIRSGIDWVLGKVLAPIWELLKGAAKKVLDGIRWIINGIASAISWVKSNLSRAWGWVKDLLGMDDADAGSGGEDDGAWAWVKRKASAAWEGVKSTFMSWLPALKTVGKVLLLLSPFGPLIVAFKYGPKLVKWLSDLWGTLSNPDNLVKARGYVTNTLLPGAMGFLRSMAAGVDGVAHKVASALGQLSGPLGELASKFDATALLERIGAAVRWLALKVEAGVKWAIKTLSAAFDAVAGFLKKLWAWLKPILEVLLKVVAVIANPLGLPLFFASWVWLKLPNCFKPPLINFVLDLLIKFVGLWPEAPLLGPLLPLVKHGILGFLRQVRGEKDEKKIEVSNRIAKLLSGGSVDFMLGFLKGTLVGIWDGIIGPFELVYMVVKFVPQVIGFFASLVDQLPTHAAKVVASARGLADDAVANFWPAVKSVFSSSGGSGTSIFGLLKSVWNAITGAASWIGGKVAGALIGFVSLPDSELGSKLGWVAGTVIFEVALAILTAGGSALLSALKGPIGLLAKLLVKVNKVMEKVFGAILHLIPGLEKGLGKALHFLTDNAVMKPIIAKLKSLFDNIIELGVAGLQRFGRDAAERGAETAGRKVAQGVEDLAGAATRTESRGARAADDVGAAGATKVDGAGQTGARAEADAAATGKAEAGAPARAENKPPTETGKALDDRVAKTEKIDSPHLSKGDLDSELKHLSENPHLLQGTPPNRTAQLGEHTWVENSAGGWCRYSNNPVCTLPPPEAAALKKAETEVVGPSGKKWNEITEADDFIKDYRARHKETKLTDDELKEYFHEGGRLNPETGRIKNPNAKTTAPPDFKAAYKGPEEAIDIARLHPDEKAQFEALLKERDKWRLERDNLANTVGSDPKKLSEARGKVNKASQDLGELASDVAVAKKFPGPPPPQRIDPGSAGAGDFDRVFKVVDNGQPRVIVVEAKGGSSTLGSREVSGGLRAEQGTREYYEKIIDVMTNSSDPALRKLGRDLGKMNPDDAIRYLHVRLPIAPDAAGASTAKLIGIKEFEIRKLLGVP